ncbi:MAG: BACON domain-containing protein [Bacteroides pyogenes]|uniref:BACON domain-containing protein n=1 Tax=Bacteroides pyogenes TaxID=310300 RepID=UPI00242EAB42|nr:BACON domain-containing protein [Bacteroides pyogenes]MCI7070505.1 BACON domain-containing protein [Bacteroides pyogenes]
MNIRNKVFLVLITFSTFVGCKKDLIESNNTEYVVMSDVKSLDFKQEGETKIIDLMANSHEYWTIDAPSETWVKAVKKGNSIEVTTEPNLNSDDRKMRLTISVVGGKMSFVINQLGTSPFISIEGENSSDFYFKKDGVLSKTIRVKANSTNWSVEPLGQVDWLSWKKDEAGENLILNLKEFKREDIGATTNRKVELFLSNGSKHLKLNVIQNGWAQFGTVICKLNQTRQQIIEAEERRGHKRDLDYDLLFYPCKQAGDKIFMGFNTDGEQTKLAVYTFDYDDKNKSTNRFYLKAYENKTFNDNDLKAWMDLNKYVKGMPDPRFPLIIKYFKEDETKTSVYIVNNDSTAKLNGFDYKSANMEYLESSNYMTYDLSNNSIDVFPVRNSCRINDPSYQLKEVIAYEKSQGMIPDFNHELTKKSNDPDVEYASLVFKQESVNSSKGKLIYVIYLFNYRGAKSNPANVDNAHMLSDNPALNGTVAMRHDVYQGLDYIYKVRPMYHLNSTTRLLLENKGYSFLRDDGNGFATFIRGDEDFVDIYPSTSWFNITFYKNKEEMKKVKFM